MMLRTAWVGLVAREISYADRLNDCRVLNTAPIVIVDRYSLERERLHADQFLNTATGFVELSDD